jgi:hypothetical protein
MTTIDIISLVLSLLFAGIFIAAGFRKEDQP